MTDLGIKLDLQDRPDDAIEAIAYQATERAQKAFEGITDPEALLEARKALREQREAIESRINSIRDKNAKQNKQRAAMLAKWTKFKSEFVKHAEKYGIDLLKIPITATGRTFAEKIQNANPETFVTVEGRRIPQKRGEHLLESEKIRLYEIQAKQKVLEDVISRKANALKAIFDKDPE